MSGWFTNPLKLLLRPKIFLPILFTGAFLAFAFSLGNLPKAFGYIRHLSPLAIAIAFAFAIGYLLLKGIMFAILLRELDLGIDRRALIHAYAIGEMTLPVPAGVYAQNYVLQRIHGLKFGRSSAATTAMLLLELLVVLVTLLFVPVPGWGWLRPAIGCILAIGLAVVAIFLRAHGHRQRSASWLAGYRVGRGILDLTAGMRRLLVPRIFLPGFLLSFAYLFLVAMALFAVGQGMGIHTLGPLQALSIHFFSLGVVMVVGSFLTKLGLMEVVGLTAAEAWGYSWTEGLAILLGFRLVWMGSVWVITGVTVWWLRDQFRLRPNENDDPQPDGNRRA